MARKAILVFALVFFICSLLAELCYGSPAARHCGLKQGFMNISDLLLSYENGKLIVTWNIAAQRRIQKVFYGVHVHHWQDALDVPQSNAAISHPPENGYWGSAIRLKLRHTNHFHEIEDGAVSNSYYAVELAVGTHKGIRRGLSCLTVMTGVIFTGLQSPSIKVVPGSVTVKKGTNVTLDCQVEGQPPPYQTYWLQRSLVPPTNLVADSSPEHLVFRNVQQSNNGSYQCLSFYLAIQYDYSRRSRYLSQWVTIKVM